jgi:hypothetical protein
MWNASRFSTTVVLAGILLAALGSYSFASKREKTPIAVLKVGSELWRNQVAS